MDKPVLVSFPRSGRTWLMTLIGLNICYHKGISVDNAVIERKKVLAATHDHTDKSLKVPATDLKMDPIFETKKVLFLRRDFKDTLVSAWLHATKRKGNFKGTLSEYIRDPRYGIEKIVRFNKLWMDHQYFPKSFMKMSYERLVESPEESLIEVCTFLEIRYTQDSIRKAVQFGQLENLRKKEAQGFFKEGVSKPKRPKDLETYYHRRGKVGGYVDYMTQEDIDYCDEIERRV